MRKSDSWNCWLIPSSSPASLAYVQGHFVSSNRKRNDWNRKFGPLAAYGLNSRFPHFSSSQPPHSFEPENFLVNFLTLFFLTKNGFTKIDSMSLWEIAIFGASLFFYLPIIYLTIKLSGVFFEMELRVYAPTLMVEDCEVKGVRIDLTKVKSAVRALIFRL